MARRRYYYRSRRTKQKWSYTTVELNNEVAEMQTLRAIEFGMNVIVNPTSTNLTSAVPIIKTGRFRVKGMVVPISGQLPFPVASSFIIALMYIPEGTTFQSSAGTSIDNLTSFVFYKHPEWVMGWTRFDFTNAAQRNEFSITSRLKRNLNRGDSIQLVCITANRNTTTVVPQSRFMATVSYVCRTN